MKSAGTIVRSLHVLLLALCGLSFYVLLLGLLFLIVRLLVPAHGHVSAPSDAAVATQA
ncbi:MAG TPA: hypothetical protein VLC97_14625 [Rhodanobacteraceae bacterium]|nr:hypothetical protein [Rhodanobacteraceae bacterium]